MAAQNIQFGLKVKDKITGFTGTVTGFTTYITGCSQYLVQPPVKKEGDFTEGRWIDEDRLEQQDGEAISLKRKINGADIPAPIR
jgi:hypothetical protein